MIPLIGMAALIAALVTIAIEMAGQSGMLPQVNFSSAGSATPGTVFGGAFEGPLTVQETGLTFLRLTKNVSLTDAVAGTVAGAAAANGHAYLLALDNVQNVIAVLYASALQPGSAQRHAPAIKLPAGHDLIVRAVQLSGAAAEATTLTLFWA